MQSSTKQRKAEKQKDELRKMCLIEENKTCAVCSMRGPLYVVLDFQTFVCSTCSAIHRSMQHKVKGITMSDFTDEEIAALRVGGNQRAAKVWKHGYRNAIPRDEIAAKNFIRTCYQDKLFFNAAEYDALMNDIAVASLPPLVVLNNGALGDNNFGVATLPNIQTDSQPPRPKTEQPKPTQGVTVANAPPPSKAVAMTSQFDGLDFFQSSSQAPVSAPSPAVPPPAATESVDPFDSFFTSRQSTVAASAPSVSGGDKGTHGGSIGMSDLFGPSTTESAATAAYPQSVIPPISNFFQESAWQANPSKPPQVTQNTSQVPNLFAM